jgi:hypothetical protein
MLGHCMYYVDKPVHLLHSNPDSLLEKLRTKRGQCDVLSRMLRRLVDGGPNVSLRDDLNSRSMYFIDYTEVDWCIIYNKK